MKNLTFICAIAWLCSCNGQASESDSAKMKLAMAPVTPVMSVTEVQHYQNAVAHFIDSTFNYQRFNGSILVAKNGQVIYEKYSGFRNPRQKTDSINPGSAFHLASVSKTFTAMAVLKLAQDGKLKVTDSVTKYLPAFPLPGVTIRTLLNHRSGIPNYVHYMERLGWDRRKLITNQDVLDFIVARHNEIQIGPPDRHFSYSNTNFALLALIVEKVSGQAFPDFLKFTFFQPLGMTSTYVYTMADSARSLQSYFPSGRQYAFDYLDKVYGDKNVYTTVRDMLKWDQALYPGGMFTQATLDSAFKGYSYEKPGINNYGLGWRMFNLKNGKKFIYHNGWWHGNRTAFYHLPDEKVTIIAFSNNDYMRVYSSKKIADIFGNYFTTPEIERATETVNTVKEASPEP